MKKITTLITTLFILSFFAALSARATVIWNDTFQYPNGSLAATNSTYTPVITNSVSLGLWLRESGTGNPDDMYMVNSNLQVSGHRWIQNQPPG